MKKSLPIIIKSLAIILSLYGMMRSIEHWMFFTYFTNLSNIFVDVMLLISIVYDIKGLRPTKTVNVLKFYSIISITLTCLVYLFLLAPTKEGGMIHAYMNNGAGSLCVHLLTPLLAMFDFICFDDFDIEKKDVYLSIVPPLIYVGYVIVLGQFFSIRWYDGMLAPYNFLNYGAKTGWFGFDLSILNSMTLGVGCFYTIVVLALIFIGIGHVLKKVKSKKLRVS